MKIEYTPIGYVHSPFNTLDEIPNQPHHGKGITGRVEVLPEFAPGLKDLDGFSHVVLICHFHQSRGYRLEVVPPGETRPRGLFATRAPVRPNPVGLSVVRLEKIEKNILRISNLDILDKTPVIDIKPYISEHETLSDVHMGWIDGQK